MVEGSQKDSSHSKLRIESRPTLLSWSRISDGRFLAFFALVAGWLLFFNAIRSEWQINPQYSYGYVVPLLCAVLISRRWPERPVPERASGRIASLVAGLLLLPLLPWWVILEANPEWRLLYWFGGVGMIGLSFGLVYALGGWKWVRYFAPPLLFVLVAIPWPMELEHSMIQGLTKFVANLTVEIAGILDIPAVQRGNLIEIRGGIVGIDEACSGVRSMQTALMLSLFLGEMHRLSGLRRIGLVGASFLLTLIANLSRTTFLVWAAANRGFHQMELWHDMAGNLVMFIVLPSLFGLGYLMKPKTPQLIAPPAASPALIRMIPRWVGVTALIWIGLCAAATEIWYRSHESALVNNPNWSVNWPEQYPEFKKSAVPEKSLAILRCSNSEAASWVDEAGYRWNGFFLRWNPGRNSAQLAKGHSPDICFPAAGAKLVEDVGPITVSVNAMEMPFRHLSFQSGADLLHVFYCLWSDQASRNDRPAREDGSMASRWEAVLAGKRNLGQQAMEIVIAGAESNDAAVNLLKQQLPALIRRRD